MSDLRYKYDQFAYYAGKPIDALSDIMGISKDDRARMKYLISGMPVIGDVVNTVDSMKYQGDYLKNRGLSWSDRRYYTSGPSGVGSTVNYVSSNIKRLYR